jgi:hypothetical protein
MVLRDAPLGGHVVNVKCSVTTFPIGLAVVAAQTTQVPSGGAATGGGGTAPEARGR